ncbi:hypothetical protein NIM88_03925 [Pseudomonas sp. GBPI_506]|uniref:hypothetical protein n=1 Tax=Pseudomonas sp. GBPI_506 TaxID=1735795 RepID=UPI0020CD5F41|nr:hypothetical protein [Pseudomonas sp. GBPI_506]MCP9731535.1 hypothetical protein [Pseudomonas sp. GBPI_506]
MTTNQTIDGVSRELLERLLTDACNENWSDLNELLHSATTCRCKRYGKGNPHWPCPAHPAPAAQPQGEPVAWMFKYLSHSDSPPYRTFEVTDFHQNPKAPGIAEHTPLYAEQPAPVAVVLPERYDMPHRDEFESADHYAAATGETKKWNECIDEVAKINTHTVSVGLLRRIVGHPLVLPVGPDQIAAIQELSQIGKLNN